MKRNIRPIILISFMLALSFFAFGTFYIPDENKRIGSNLEWTKNKNVLLFDHQEKIVDGTYMSREDTLAGIIIKGKKLIMFHRSTGIDTSDYFDFKITDKVIDDGRPFTDGRFLTLSNKEMILKYAIEHWDENWISLIYLPRGNFHNYYREKSSIY